MEHEEDKLHQQHGNKYNGVSYGSRNFERLAVKSTNLIFRTKTQTLAETTRIFYSTAVKNTNKSICELSNWHAPPPCRSPVGGYIQDGRQESDG